MELAEFEFKKERKLGEFVQDFINLLKIIIGHLSKVLFTMLALPICAMLLVGYYVSTQLNTNISYTTEEALSMLSGLLIGVGIMSIIGLMAFGFTIEYFILLRDRRNLDFGISEVWTQFKNHITLYFRFLAAAIIVGIVVSIPLGILIFICIFIPLIGSIGVGIIISAATLWFVSAFLLYREGYYELIDSFNEAFSLLKHKIFEYALAAYVVTFLFQSLLYLINLLPILVIGIITFNSVGFDVDFFDTLYGKIIMSVGGSMLTLFFIIYNMLSVLSFGIIYETAKELKFGENIFERIANIGRKVDG